MTVMTLRLDLRVSHCPSPRDKRRQMRAIVDKLHRHFNVSVAETDGEGDPGQAVLVVAAVGRTRRDARETIERVADAVAAHPLAEVLAHAVSEV
jgi:uncharacterized protein YlxP (DUF503 family)